MSLFARDDAPPDGVHSDLPIEGAGRFVLGLDVRSPAGQVASLSFTGTLRSRWQFDVPDTYPVFDAAGSETASRSMILDGAGYEVRVSFGLDPAYAPGWDDREERVETPDGVYRRQWSGQFYASVLPTAATPEPGTLALAGFGLCAAAFTRCRRRAG